MLAEQLTPERFRAAWEKVRQSPASGADGVNRDRFAIGLDWRLSELRRTVLAGAWRPAPLLRLEVPKKDGGVRVLGIPTVGDRVVQRAVLSAVEARAEGALSERVHGYRKSRSPGTAVRHLVRQAGRQGWLEVVQADISAMFDELDQRDVLAAAEALLADPLWRSLTQASLHAWASSPGRGVPQGSPLSPLLANLTLARALDQHLDDRCGGAPTLVADPARRLAAARGVVRAAIAGRGASGDGPRSATTPGPELGGWIRYGDDLVLVGTRRGEGLDLLRWLDGLARGAGLRLSERKTVTAAGRHRMPLPRRVLGHGVVFLRQHERWSLGVEGLPVDEEVWGG